MPVWAGGECRLCLWVWIRPVGMHELSCTCFLSCHSFLLLVFLRHNKFFVLVLLHLSCYVLCCTVLTFLCVHTVIPLVHAHILLVSRALGDGMCVGLVVHFLFVLFLFFFIVFFTNLLLLHFSCCFVRCVGLPILRVCARNLFVLWLFGADSYIRVMLHVLIVLFLFFLCFFSPI